MVINIGRKLLISLIVSGFLLGILVFEGTKARIHLIESGQENIVSTHASTVEEFLEQEGIEISNKDIISPHKNTKISNGMTINYKSANQIMLSVNGEEEAIWTTANTVGEVVKSEGITITDKDNVIPNTDTKITKSMSITVNKAIPVIIKDGGEQKEIWTNSITVADLLDKQGIELNTLDRIEPSLQNKVKEKMEITVTRVEKVTDVVEEPVEYAVVTKKDSSLTAGNERVIQSGKEGLVKKYYEVILENGKEISRELVNSETVKDSKDKIVALGTKQLDAAVVSRGDTNNVAKTVYMKATAYTAYCTGCSGVTRTGINLRKNPQLKVVAVDPDVIPLGTKLWVEGYGYAVAGDTGGAIKGNRIDLFMPDRDKVLRFGVKNVQVKIFK